MDDLVQAAGAGAISVFLPGPQAWAVVGIIGIYFMVRTGKVIKDWRK